MIKKIFSIFIIISFLLCCIIPGLSGVKLNIIKSNLYYEQTNDDIIPPEEQWNITFKKYGWGNYIRETSDGGYKIISNIWDEPPDNMAISVIKTDKDANLEWRNNIDFFEFKDMLITSFIETSDGGYLFAGNIGGYRGDVNWGEGLFVVKADENGIEEWNYQYYEYDFTWAFSSVKECPDGGFIVVFTNEFYQNADTLLFKFYGNGNIQWTKLIEQENDEFTYIYPTDDRGFLVGGRIANDMWILKLDVVGNEEWEVIFTEGHGTMVEYPVYIHPSSSQGYLIVVDTRDESYFKVIEIDNFGNEISNKTFDGGTIFSILETDDDGFIVFFKKSKDIHLIKFSSTNSYGYLSSFIYNGSSSKKIRKTSDDGYILFSNFNYEGFYLVKLDSLGNKIWENFYNIGFRGYEKRECFTCRDIDETNDEGYIICGTHLIYDSYYCEFGCQNLWVIKLGENNPPSIPVLEGITKGKINKNYTFSAISTDTEDDKISYFFDWGDGTNNNWTEYYSSGVKINVTNNWKNKGNYIIRVKAKDEHGVESDWSEPLNVTMPRNKILDNKLFSKLFNNLIEKIFLNF